MYALETNTDSTEHARRNVAHNKLDDFVTVFQQPKESVTFEGLCSLDSFKSVDFCMCNPPFFNSQDQLATSPRKNRTGRRPQPKSTETGASDELIATGGECQFVQQIIEESCRLRERIRVYTTMLGHKSSVQRILHRLSAAGITNTATTEFYQGQTTRWGVCWSFIPSILLRTVPTFGTQLPKKKPCIFNVPATPDGTVAGVIDVQTKLGQLLANIGLKLEQKIHSSGVVTGRVSAMSNTWSKQRRKRREIERLAIPQFENHINEDFDSLYKSDDDKGPSSKLRRVDMTSSVFPSTPVLVMDINIYKHPTKGVAIKLEYLNGSANHDGVYQVLQFIRNHWK